MLRETGSMHKTLIHFGMAPKGGNYVRTKRLVEQHGINLLPRSGVGSVYSKLTSQDIENIKEWRANGKSYRWIANQLGVHRQTVMNVGKTTYK